MLKNVVAASYSNQQLMYFINTLIFSKKCFHFHWKQLMPAADAFPSKCKRKVIKCLRKVIKCLQKVTKCLQKVINCLQKGIKCLQKVIKCLQKVTKCLQKVINCLQKGIKCLQKVIKCLQKVYRKPSFLEASIRVLPVGFSHPASFLSFSLCGIKWPLFDNLQAMQCHGATQSVI